VDIRVLGRIGKKGTDLKVQKLPKRRLHVRAIVRDGRRAFVGSQSLRKLELDARREVGIIIREPKIVKRLQEVFEADWAQTPLAQEAAKAAAKAETKTDEKPETKTEAAAAAAK
jgi:phosphatidylserine/phosphatidylglycerophosphate/cardiolipin synthase-like enzyme